MQPQHNIAARAGRWSAQHRKKAIFGWMAFVIASLVIGGALGVNTLSDEDSGLGESGRADKTLHDSFPGDRGDHSLVAAVPVRRPVRALDGRSRRSSSSRWASASRRQS
jgi:hypothetical protein